jgi:hypothetical protein
MRIALYEHDGYQSVWPEKSAEYLSGDPHYVRVSEYIDVDFPMLAPEAVVGAQLAAIGAEELAIRERLARELATLEDRRAKLRALTVQP